MSKPKQDLLPRINLKCSEVARFFGVTVPWMMADKNSRLRVKCRYLAMALIRRDTQLSLTEIADQFLVDHTTVKHGLKRAKTYPEYSHFFEKGQSNE